MYFIGFSCFLGTADKIFEDEGPSCTVQRVLTYVSKQFFGSGLLTGLSEVVNSFEPANSDILQNDSLGSWPRMFMFLLLPTNNS